MKKFLLSFFLFTIFINLYSIDVLIDCEKQKHKISPFIYGTNQDLPFDLKITARRLGGNRMTGYNWENNASNAGADWQHSSDNYMIDQLGIFINDKEETGKLLTVFHEKSISLNAYSLITLPLAGYVAKDKKGPVGIDETAPSSRWAKVIFNKPNQLLIEPDKNDDFVYVDEEVNFLVNKFGKANTVTGVKGYALDNEPDIWQSTHPRIHKDKTGAEEYIEKSIEAAKTVKKIDEFAEIFGPVSYGYNGFKTFQNAPDFVKASWQYGWYLAYYLAKMKEASDKEGKRLLDVLDIHWYPEATGNGKRIVFSQGNPDETASARVQAPRSLWDENFVERSWICDIGDCPIALIPKIKKMIDKYYPGTKLAITEYEYGAGYHISGGIALADVLGIFGKYDVYMANYWMVEWGAFSYAAFKLYRNYDGNGSTYGDLNVKAISSDVEKISIYASLESERKNILHAIVINKDLENAQNVKIKINSKTTFEKAEIWGFNKETQGKIIKKDEIKIKNNMMDFEIPSLSAYHLVFM